MLSLQAVNRVLGNCSEFYEEQTRRLLDLGVDAAHLSSFPDNKKAGERPLLTCHRRVPVL